MSIYYPNNIVYEFGEILLEDQIEKKQYYFMDKYKAEIYSREKDIPHIHLTKKGEPDICICLYSNEIYVHANHTGTLNSGECKKLYKWMKKCNSKGFVDENKKPMTNWEVATFLWWDINPRCNFPKPQNPIMPDYRHMTIRKEE